MYKSFENNYLYYSETLKSKKKIVNTVISCKYINYSDDAKTFHIYQDVSGQ